MKMMLKSFLASVALLCFGMTEAQTVSGTGDVLVFSDNHWDHYQASQQ